MGGCTSRNKVLPQPVSNPPPSNPDQAPTESSATNNANIPATPNPTTPVRPDRRSPDNLLDTPNPAIESPQVAAELANDADAVVPFNLSTSLQTPEKKGTDSLPSKSSALDLPDADKSLKFSPERSHKPPEDEPVSVSTNPEPTPTATNPEPVPTPTNPENETDSHWDDWEDTPAEQRQPLTSRVDADTEWGKGLAPLAIGGTEHNGRLPQLQCSSCGFDVLRFRGCSWAPSADYMHFRNFNGHSLNMDKLQEKLEKAPGYAAYACQCSWQSTNEMVKLDQWGTDPGDLGGAANGQIRWMKKKK